MTRTATALRPTAAIDQLRHVEAALGDDAEAAGSALLAQQLEEAARVLEAARTEAERIVEEGRAEGADVGARLVSAARATCSPCCQGDRACRSGRRLRARCAERVLDELASRQGTDEVNRLNRRLERRATRAARPEVDDPSATVSVSGSSPRRANRRVELSADRLVDDCLAELGEALERLWS